MTHFMKRKKYRQLMSIRMRAYKKTISHKSNLSLAHGGNGEVFDPEKLVFGLTLQQLERYWKWYKAHQTIAQQRKVPWRFRFYGRRGWLAKWLKSGQIENRGVRKTQYVMGRVGDVGPYSYNNVRIITASQNRKEYHINRVS